MNRRNELTRHQSGKRNLLGLVFLGLLLLATLASAQSVKDAAEITKFLSAPAQAVLQRLSILNNLPAEGWRFHAGDIAHGEVVDLDDSGWPVLQPRSDASTDAVWFRRVIEVPVTLNGYDPTGARIWFRFRASANGPMPEIIYFNGRRVALGDDLEPIVLFDYAKPGDKVLVAVKVLHTVDAKTFYGTEQRIEFPAARPNPEDVRLELLSSTLLIPSLSKNTAEDTATLEKAILAIDLKALDEKNQAKFDASLKDSQQKLEALKPLFQQSTLHLTGNSHIDAAWLWPWTETVDVVKRTFGTALQLMNEYPDYTYTQSAAAYNQWIAEKYPQMNDEIKKRIKEGRWEIVGGMWVEPDLNMLDGESLVRQILAGKRYFKQQYGVNTRIGWNPDSFGYTWQLPQIYKKSGIDYFVTQKISWNDTNQMPFKFFWWQSPDGSKVLTYFPHDYANDNLNPVRLSRDLVIARTFTPGLPSMLDLYGIGDHGGGPTRAILDEGVRWAQPDKVFPKLEFGSAQSYFTAQEAKIDKNSPAWEYDSIAKGYQAPPVPASGLMSIPTWKDELYFEYHRGVMTTQATQKRNMRESEEQMLNAEKYASLAWLGGSAYPGKLLNDFWEKVLFNQFHDTAAGSGIATIYADAQRDYDEVRRATNEVSGQALQALAAAVNTRAAGDVPVVVFNPLAWERSGTVPVDVQMPAAASAVSILDAQGRVLPSRLNSADKKTNTFHLLVSVKDVPSLGYKVLHVVSGEKPVTTDLKIVDLTLENANIRVSVDKQTGCITSLFDRKSNFETLAKGACGNELIAFKDTPKDYDAWNVDADFEKVFTKLDKADSVELIENGPMRAVIRVTRLWQSSKFVQDITLLAGSDQVDIVNDFDWHETHVLLKAAFPLAAYSAKATYEIPYGTIDRPTTRNNSWEKAKFEVPALRWADLGDGQHGLSIINEAKYGYDSKDNVLRITLLRSPIWPDPDADRGHQHFSYTLYPHSGDWKQAGSVRRGYEYNYKLQAMQVSAHAGTLPLEHSFVNVTPENVVLTALKKAEDSDGLILRVYEWAGKGGDLQITVPKGATSATVTNLMEAQVGTPLPVSHDKVTVPIHPYEILSVRLDYPGTKQ